MKFNKWTLGLAAVGAVSMASAVRADEAPKMVPLTTALSSTVISGYVDVAAQYVPGDFGPGAGIPIGTQGTQPGVNKIDNFTLNDVLISLDHPQDESPWAAGYHIDVNYGTDAVGVNLNGTQPTAAAGSAATLIRQAYVVVRTPVGNGIDWKFGVQDDVIGYESNTGYANPNYTRSIGYSVEPTTLLGLIGSYKICDWVTVQGGLADATSPLSRPLYDATGTLVGTTPPNSSDKTVVGAVAFTAPDSWGWAKGATLNAGALLNVSSGGQYNYYVGATLPTPYAPLKVGAAFDLVSVNNQSGATASTPANPNNDSGWVIGLYATLQPTDKLSLNVRGEYYDLAGSPTVSGPVYFNGTDGKGEEFTATVSYNLWANVLSRAEFRVDHIDGGSSAFANGMDQSYSFLLAVNLVYMF